MRPTINYVVSDAGLRRDSFLWGQVRDAEGRDILGIDAGTPPVVWVVNARGNLYGILPDEISEKIYGAQIGVGGIAAPGAVVLDAEDRPTGESNVYAIRDQARVRRLVERVSQAYNERVPLKRGHSDHAAAIVDRRYDLDFLKFATQNLLKTPVRREDPTGYFTAEESPVQQKRET